MRAEDIAGLTLIQIQDEYALQETPKFVMDVTVPAELEIRNGV